MVDWAMYARLEFRESAGGRRERAVVVDDESTSSSSTSDTIDGGDIYDDDIYGGDGYRSRVGPISRSTGKPISKVAVKPFITEFES